MIVPTLPVALDIQLEEENVEEKLKDVIANLKLPKGVELIINKDNSLTLKAQDQMLGGHIIMPINEKLITNIKEQLNNGLTK